MLNLKKIIFFSTCWILLSVGGSAQLTQGGVMDAPESFSQFKQEPHTENHKVEFWGLTEVGRSSFGISRDINRLECNTSIEIDFIPGWTNDSIAPLIEAFELAADIWESIIISPETIRVQVVEADLGSYSNGSILLGRATLNNYQVNFNSAPISNIYYPQSLANSKAETDLGANYDMKIEISSFASTQLSANPLTPEINFYYGLDAFTPEIAWNMVSLALHEIGHGLGMVSSVWNSAGGTLGNWGYGYGPTNAKYPFIYDTFIVNASSSNLTNVPTGSGTNTNTGLHSLFTSGNHAYFNGPYAVSANNNGLVELNLDDPWSGSSSLNHLDTTAFPYGTPNALETPWLKMGEGYLDPGPVMINILKDLGWEICPTALNIPPSVEQPEEVVVFPNPARQSVHIFPRNEINSIEIIEARKRASQNQITIESDRNYFRFNVKELSSGIYFLKIRLKDGRTISKKLMIR